MAKDIRTSKEYDAQFKYPETLITGDFETDKNTYYSLYAPNWGGYSFAIGEHGINSYPNLEYSKISVIEKEKYDFWDYDNYVWLKNNPIFYPNQTLTKKYSQDRFKILLYYHKSDVELYKNWAGRRIIIETSPYIKNEIKNKGFTEPSIFEEILQTCYGVLIKNIDMYDPTYKITTFLSNGFISHAVHLTIANNRGIKKTLSDNVNKVKRAYQECIEDGIDNPTTTDIHYKLNSLLSMEVIENCLSILIINEGISIEEIANNVASEKKSDDSAIQNIIYDSLYKAIDTLKEDEKEVFMLYWGNEIKGGYDQKPMPPTNIAKYLSKKYNKTVSLPKVYALLERAYRRIKNNKDLSSYYREDKKEIQQDRITLDKTVNSFFISLYDDEDGDDDIIEGRKK